MKSFSTCCASDRRRTAWAVVALLILSSSAAAAKKPVDPDDLFNPLLGVDHAHWLVGSIVRIASEKEVEQYLRLTSDDEAAAFIKAFWDRRNAETPLFKKTPRQTFDSRTVEADKQFTESAYPGHRTDRGAIWILYGEPEEVVFESPEKVGHPTLEVWKYSSDAEPGLDGEKPKKSYRFFKDGELTVFYTGQKRRGDARQRTRQRF